MIDRLLAIQWFATDVRPYGADDFRVVLEHLLFVQWLTLDELADSLRSGRTQPLSRFLVSAI